MSRFQVFLLNIFLLWNFVNVTAIQDNYIFRYHDPEVYTPALDNTYKGSQLIDLDATPDFRVVEPQFVPAGYYRYKPKSDGWILSGYMEEERPYRGNPHYVQSTRWTKKDSMDKIACYCTTVYRQFIALAGCAVLTTRHVLTTATSTLLILKAELPKLKKNQNLAYVLGVVYDVRSNVLNSSRYMDIARIHIHPEYLAPDKVNITHPIPCYHDIALWATARYIEDSSATCYRGGPSVYDKSSSTPKRGQLALIVGYQFIKAWRRRPLPWFKYVIRTRRHIVPCPKTEWGWFHCLLGGWARFGIESGAAWHRALEGKSYLHDGLIGLNAFSSTLRSEEMTHYFTVINTHKILDFLGQAYFAEIPYAYLDNRFQNSKGVPQLKGGFSNYKFFYEGDSDYASKASQITWW